MKFINDNRKTRDQWSDNIVDIKTASILEMQIHILMELTIHRSIMIHFPIVTHHRSFSRKIDSEKSDI